MQFEFAEASNRVFIKTRTAFLAIAILSVFQLAFLALFHFTQFSALGQLGAFRLAGNLLIFAAFVVLFAQSVSAAKGLRSIVKTSGNDVPTYIHVLNRTRNVLSAILALLVINLALDFVNHPSFVACLKLS